MDLLSTNCCLRLKSQFRNSHFHSVSQFLGVDREICGCSSSPNFFTKLCCVSHFAAREGWPVLDCSADITFSFELWHLELIAGSVILVSSSRFLLLKTWPDFAESSQAANQQVLTSLEPLDYLLVAFLPGISEELLFRGALLPLFGVNWTSIFAVAALFGVLHLGSGRKYSFAVWATFVGLVYGYATTLSSSIIVPMASHALNNLVGGIIWRYSSNSSKSTR
ncbi:UNVERIFIED_CONTAM: hypothetical protein Sradi_2936600 [Sesamum radiatum]|uniref:CAAX prenyl protease 2/Lysostaphin resistance protein A-like domain-containing protein n=1 Tax=Sesamum radiatum TaxID=300843 RepID=A0AAW2RYU6_SESRA